MQLLKRACQLLTVLSLSSCATTLSVNPYIISLKNQACGEYQIDQQDPLTFKFVKWHPLTDCDGMYAFSATQTTTILRKYRAYQETQ